MPPTHSRRGRPRTYRKRKRHQIPSSKIRIKTRRKKTRRKKTRRSRRKDTRRMSRTEKEFLLPILEALDSTDGRQMTRAFPRVGPPPNRVPGIGDAFKLSKAAVSEFNKGNVGNAISLVMLSQAIAGSYALHPNVKGKRFCPSPTETPPHVVQIRPDDLLQFYPNLWEKGHGFDE